MFSINNVIRHVNTGAIGATISAAHKIQQMKRKPLSPEDQAAAARLRTLWDAKKNKLGLTQEKAASTMGFNTQAAVSHYLNGYTPLNTDAILKFAALLKVSPSEIREGITDLLAPATRRPEKFPAVGGRKVWVIGRGEGGMPDRIWTDGDFPVGASDEYAEERTDDAHAFIVRVNGDSMSPRYMPGEYVLIEPSIAPELEDDVLVRLADGKTLIKRLLSRRGGIRLGSYSTQDVMTFREEEITWMYYVSNRVPSHKIKHWVEAPEYAGEDRRHEQDQHEPERRTEAKPPPKMPTTAVRAGPPAHPKKTVRRTGT